jgi:hypothetical protein
MASTDGTTRKWVARFCELMDWFIGVEKVHGDNLGEAHVKGLAANYLAVKLGVFDPTIPIGALDPLDKEPPYRPGDWECDHPEIPSYQQIRQWRLERMTHWKRKAEDRGVFKATPFSPDVTPDRIHRYCDCLEGIIYRAHDWTLHAELTALGRQANDLAVKLGLTHPDWLLAMDLAILPLFVGADDVQDLPLPWEYDKPPVLLRNPPRVVDESDIPRLRESLKKAQALLRQETAENHKDASASQGIPPEYRSAPLSLKRMAELYGGDMTAKKLRIMIDNGRIPIETINRQAFVFDTRKLPDYVVEKMRR